MSETLPGYVGGDDALHLQRIMAGILPNAASDHDPRVVRAIGDYAYYRLRSVTTLDGEQKSKWLKRARGPAITRIYALNGGNVFDKYFEAIESEIFRAVSGQYPKEQISMPETYD